MIKSFHHSGLQIFFETGSKAGIQAIHAPRLSRMLARLNESTHAHGMNLPGWKLHPLRGKALKNHFSVWVSGN
jgi:proteic killer suppression protein